MSQSPYNAAYIDGWKAHKNQIISGENPYHEFKQDYSHRQWLSGWYDRFDAIKYGKEDRTLDEL